MSKPKFRVISSEACLNQREKELDRISGAAEPRRVSVPLGKIVPLLIDAGKHERVWLSDFADDLIHIDSDLYDVLLAYQQLQQRSAA